MVGTVKGYARPFCNFHFVSQPEDLVIWTGSAHRRFEAALSHSPSLSQPSARVESAAKLRVKSKSLMLALQKETGPRRISDNSGGQRLRAQ